MIIVVKAPISVLSRWEMSESWLNSSKMSLKNLHSMSRNGWFSSLLYTLISQVVLLSILYENKKENESMNYQL